MRRNDLRHPLRVPFFVALARFGTVWSVGVAERLIRGSGQRDATDLPGGRAGSATHEQRRAGDVPPMGGSDSRASLRAVTFRA